MQYQLNKLEINKQLSQESQENNLNLPRSQMKQSQKQQYLNNQKQRQLKLQQCQIKTTNTCNTNAFQEKEDIDDFEHDDEMNYVVGNEQEESGDQEQVDDSDEDHQDYGSNNDEDNYNYEQNYSESNTMENNGSQKDESLEQNYINSLNYQKDKINQENNEENDDDNEDEEEDNDNVQFGNNYSGNNIVENDSNPQKNSFLNQVGQAGKYLFNVLNIKSKKKQQRNQNHNNLQDFNSMEEEQN